MSLCSIRTMVIDHVDVLILHITCLKHIWTYTLNTSTLKRSKNNPATSMSETRVIRQAIKHEYTQNIFKFSLIYLSSMPHCTVLHLKVWSLDDTAFVLENVPSFWSPVLCRRIPREREKRLPERERERERESCRASKEVPFSSHCVQLTLLASNITTNSSV